MNSKEIKQHDAEQEQIARALDAKKRKKRLIRLAVTVGAALVVLVALYLILRRCGSGERPSYSYDPLSEDNGEGFVSQSVDFDIAKSVIEPESSLDSHVKIYKFNHINRMNIGICSAENGTIFLDMLTILERVGDHANNVAFSIPRNKLGSIVKRG